MKMYYIWIFIAILLVLAGAILFYLPTNTVPENLGIFDNRLTELKTTPNGIASLTAYVKKRVQPLPMMTNISETQRALLIASQSYGRVEIFKQTDHYLHLIFTTPIMRYKDDVEFLIDPLQNIVHVRSQSRIGRSDLGLNRKRFNRLRELYLNAGD